MRRKKTSPVMRSFLSETDPSAQRSKKLEASEVHKLTWHIMPSIVKHNEGGGANASKPMLSTASISCDVVHKGVPLSHTVALVVEKSHSARSTPGTLRNALATVVPQLA
jgi:hypothetical protein